MTILEIIVIAIGLAMDAFAVSICKGLSIKKISFKNSSIIALYFGFFQAFMPVIGYFLGNAFAEQVMQIDHWIAFGLLFLIGGNMIREALLGKNDENNDSIDFRTMIILSIATSIDALAVGVTFAFLNVNLIIATLIIGIITFALSLVGVKMGNKFGNKFEKKSEVAGGIVLILIGTKILLEHLKII